MSAETQHHQVPGASTVDTWRVLWVAGGAFVLLIGAVVALDSIYRHAVPVRSMPAPQTFPEPQLRRDERTQLQQILETQRRRLNAYRWADDKHQFAQIPIARAMQIIAQEGTQAYAPLIASTPALSSPAAGAERAITPGGNATSAPTTTGSSATGTTGQQPQSAPNPQQTPREGPQ